MAAAKSLTAEEINTVLTYTAQHAYAERNRAMFLLTAMAGLRVSEVAGLTLADVQNADGTVRAEVFVTFRHKGASCFRHIGASSKRSN